MTVVGLFCKMIHKCLHDEIERLLVFYYTAAQENEAQGRVDNEGYESKESSNGKFSSKNFVLATRRAL